MGEFLEKLVEAFGIGVLIPFVLLLCLWHADDQLQDVFKDRFATFLLSGSRMSSNRSAGQYFVQFFDSIFGNKFLSRRFILRSVLASSVAVLTMSVTYIILNGVDRFFNSALVVLLGTLILNLVPDYISLVESRLIIGKMVGKRRLIIFYYLVLDLILTTVIVVSTFYLAVIVFALVGERASMNIPGDFLPIFRMAAPAIITLGNDTHPSSLGVLGIFVYSTYFTSAWVLLHTSAILLIQTRGVMRPIRHILRIRERPFRAVGIVMFLPSIVISIVVAVLV